MTIYEYKPLEGERSIRILELFGGDAQSNLRCILHHVSLSTNPEYEALSYVWGQADFHHLVDCEGCELAITESVYVVLKRLRLREGVRRLWIDAVCINQKDIPERNQQVLQMKAVYEQCKNVIVWLGQDQTGDARQAFETVRELSELTKLHYDRLRPGMDAEKILHDHFKYDETIPLSAPGSPLRCLTKLLARDWFRRVWVVQEAISAPIAVVLCGEQEVAWEHLQSACELLMRVLGLCKAERAALQVANMALVSYHMSHGKTYDLLELAQANQSCKATDPRDKLYALLGMSTDVKVFAADYALDVDTVYRDFAVHCLRNYSDLNVLSYCTYDASPAPQKPSWVPDWSTSSYRRPANDDGEPSQIFAAAGSTQKSMDFLENNTVLRVAGLLFDRVKGLHRTYTDSDYPASDEETDSEISDEEVSQNEDEHFSEDDFKTENDGPTSRNQKSPLKTTLQRCFDLAMTSELYASEEDLATAFWHSLVGGRDVNGGAVSSEYFAHYKNYRQMDFWLTEGTLPEHSEDPEFEEISCSSEIFSQAHNSHSGYKSWCVTEKGYLGYVPAEAEEGDMIVVLLGAKVPYLLRRSGDYHLLIGGECYVYGIMHGETLRSIRDEDIEKFHVH